MYEPRREKKNAGEVVGGGSTSGTVEAEAKVKKRGGENGGMMRKGNPIRGMCVRRGVRGAFVCVRVCVD